MLAEVLYQCLNLYTVLYWVRISDLTSLQQHPAGVLLWFHAGSSPGFRCSFPRCRGRAAWLNRPRCTHHRRRNSSASTESWTQKTQGEYIKKPVLRKVTPSQEEIWVSGTEIYLHYLQERVIFTPANFTQKQQWEECLPVLSLPLPT